MRETTKWELPFDSAEFRLMWAVWEQHRKEIRKKLTPTTTRLQLKKLAAMGETRAIAALKHSIEQGWTGIFEPKGGAPGTDLRRRVLDSANAFLSGGGVDHEPT